MSFGNFSPLFLSACICAWVRINKVAVLVLGYKKWYCSIRAKPTEQHIYTCVVTQTLVKLLLIHTKKRIRTSSIKKFAGGHLCLACVFEKKETEGKCSRASSGSKTPAYTNLEHQRFIHVQGAFEGEL